MARKAECLVGSNKKPKQKPNKGPVVSNDERDTSLHQNPTDDLKQKKKVLRKRFLSARSELSKREQADLGQQICNSVEEWLFHRNGEETSVRVVALYAAMRDEADLEPLAKRLRQKGIVTAYPKCYSERRMSFYNVHSLEELSPGSFGVPEPVGDQADVVDAESIDVMLIPGLAYTYDGARLGYGGGFYDTFLSNPRLTCTRVGVAYAVQVTPELPLGPLDQRVSFLVTEKGVRPCM